MYLPVFTKATLYLKKKKKKKIVMDSKPGDTGSRTNKFGSTRKAINYACSTFIRTNFIVAQSAGIDSFFVSLWVFHK